MDGCWFEFIDQGLNLYDKSHTIECEFILTTLKSKGSILYSIFYGIQMIVRERDVFWEE